MGGWLGLLGWLGPVIVVCLTGWRWLEVGLAPLSVDVIELALILVIEGYLPLLDGDNELQNFLEWLDPEIANEDLSPHLESIRDHLCKLLSRGC